MTGTCRPEKITTRIKDIIESYSFPNRGLTVDQYIQAGMSQFFNFNFPWYADNNAGLEEFKSLFLHKYYMHQIGQETEALFKLYLQTRLMEQMPRWKQLYQSTLFQYEPLINRKLTRNETFNDNRNGTTTDDSTTTGHNSLSSKQDSDFNTQRNGTNSLNQDTQSINSDNPQITVQTKDYAATMERGKLANNGTTSDSGKDTSSATRIDTGDSTSKLSGNRTEKETKDRNGNIIETGFIGNDMGDNIEKYRSLILNLNLEICEYMRGLFLMVYN